MKKLVFDISGHGLGHASQTIPVLRYLHADHPDWEIILRTSVGDRIFNERLGFAFRRDASPSDVTLIMDGPAAPNAIASANAYEALHANWDRRVALEADRLRYLEPDLLISNVAYTSLAAAHTIGLNAVALSSLNWLDVFDVYCASTPNYSRIRNQIFEAYAGAAAFIQLTPHTPMADLANRRSVGSVGLMGKDRRAELNERLRLPPDTRIVVVNFGGIPGVLPIPDVPSLANVHWIVPTAMKGARTDCTDFENLAVPLLDLIASCDAIITKPGYGAFVEAIANGARLLFTERQGWPETPALVAWATANGIAAAVPDGGADLDLFAGRVAAVLAEPARQKLVLTGAAEAADVIGTILR